MAALGGRSAWRGLKRIGKGKRPDEVLDQALRSDPDLFHAIYADLLHGHQAPAEIEQAPYS